MGKITDISKTYSAEWSVSTMRSSGSRATVRSAYCIDTLANRALPIATVTPASWLGATVATVDFIPHSWRWCVWEKGSYMVSYITDRFTTLWAGTREVLGDTLSKAAFVHNVSTTHQTGSLRRSARIDIAKRARPANRGWAHVPIRLDGETSVTLFAMPCFILAPASADTASSTVKRLSAVPEKTNRAAMAPKWTCTILAWVSHRLLLLAVTANNSSDATSVGFELSTTTPCSVVAFMAADDHAAAWCDQITIPRIMRAGYGSMSLYWRRQGGQC